MPFKPDTFKDIIEYYDKTRLDYRYSWDDSEHPAVHFGFYDQQVDNHKDALMNTNRVMADYGRVKEGDKVLDAGCGRGGSCFWLATNRNVQTVGITPVRSQIRECRTRARALQLEETCRFELADYCHTPFDDQSFDLVWACESLCHAVRKEDFYREAYRLLRPGGRLVIAEYLRSRRPMEADQERLLASWINRWAIRDIDTREEHEAHAEKAGFKNIEIRNVNHFTRPSLRNLHRNSSKWLWLSGLLRFFRLRSAVQHHNQVASIRQYEALRKELWYYGLIRAEK